MKTIASLFCFTLLSALACHSASAAPAVKVYLTARVRLVNDPANILLGQVQPGDVFTGSYIYDSTFPPQQQWPNSSHYQIPVPSLVCRHPSTACRYT